MEGALEACQNIHGKMHLALASSSYRDAIDGVLAGLDIAHYFEVIVSGLDVAQVKPAPDIFLKAAQQLGVEPEQCLVLEDAEKASSPPILPACFPSPCRTTTRAITIFPRQRRFAHR